MVLHKFVPRLLAYGDNGLTPKRTYGAKSELCQPQSAPSLLD
jgi:hypothetical protein